MDEKFSKPCDPNETEPRIYKRCEENGHFNPDNLKIAKDAPVFSIVLPPPKNGTKKESEGTSICYSRL